MAPLAYQGVPSAGKIGDKGGCFCYFRRPHDLLVRCVRSTVPYVFEDGGWKQRDVLVHQGDGGAERVKFPRFDGAVAPRYVTVLRFSKPQQQTNEGGFSSACGTHDAGGFPCSNVERPLNKGSRSDNKEHVLQRNGGRFSGFEGGEYSPCCSSMGEAKTSSTWTTPSPAGRGRTFRPAELTATTGVAS